MADRKISELPSYPHHLHPQDANIHYIVASGLSSEVDAQNYKVSFTGLSRDVVKFLGGGKNILASDALSINLGSLEGEARDLLLHGNTFVLGSLRVDDNLTVQGTGFFEQDLQVDENLKVQMNISGAGDLNIDGDATFQDLYVEKQAFINEKLTVTGDSVFLSDSYIEDDLFVRDDLTVTGEAFFKNEVFVHQSGFIGEDLYVSGNTYIAENLTVTGDLVVYGDSTSIETQTLTVEDHNIEIGKLASPTADTAHGGGISLLTGLSPEHQKKIYWNKPDDAWHFNTNAHIEGDQEIDGDLNVGGQVSFGEDLSVADHLNTKGLDVSTFLSVGEYISLSSIDAPTDTSSKIYHKTDGNLYWEDLSLSSAFQGADADNPGVTGLVPQPIQGDEVKYLKGDGFWTTIPAASHNTSGLVKIADQNTVNFSGLVMSDDGFLGIKDWNGGLEPMLYISDQQFKHDISIISGGLNIIESLEGVRFRWDEEAPVTSKGEEDIGLIAQQVEAVVPEAVARNTKDQLTVAYHKLIPVLIESVKELSKQNKQLESQIKELESFIKTPPIN